MRLLQIEFNKSVSSHMLLLILFVLSASFNISQSEDVMISDSERIQIAEEIWQIDSIPENASAEDISLLTGYLNSDIPKVQHIAFEKFLTIKNFKLINIDSINPHRMNMPIFEIAKIMYSDLSMAETINQVLAIADDNEWTYFQKNIADDDLFYFFLSNDWFEHLPQKLKDNKQLVYFNEKNVTSSLAYGEKKRYLFEIIDNPDNVLRYEAAIRLIIENFGKDVLDDIIQKLSSNDGLPKTEPPPSNSLHVKYHIYMTLLKSLPDMKSQSIVNQLADNSNWFIAKEAKDAKLWIDNNTPYPFKYERILLLCDDMY